jgi:hypothetical protein
MDDVHYCLPVINTVIIISCKFRVPYACKIFRGDDDGWGRRPGEKRNKRPTRRKNLDSYLGFGEISQLFSSFHYSLLDYQIFLFFCLIPLCSFSHFPLEKPPKKRNVSYMQLFLYSFRKRLNYLLNLNGFVVFSDKVTNINSWNITKRKCSKFTLKHKILL